MFVGTSTIASPGVGSGIDVNTLVTSLVDAEVQPTSLRYDVEEANTSAEISALGGVSSTLSELQETLDNLSDLASFNRRVATSSDTSILSATATQVAIETSYNITVQTLAQSQSIASSAYSSVTQEIGTGQLVFEFGTYNDDKTTFTSNPNKGVQTITINSGVQSLTGIQNTVNSSNIGVTATIVSDGLGARLVFTSDSSGTENALKITAIDDDGFNTDNAGLSELVYDPSAGTPITNATETVAAKDSLVTINGIDLTNSSNTLANAIDGVTLNLEATSASSITLTVAPDKSAPQAAVNEFVDSYNETIQLLDALTQYDPETDTAGSLNGDSTIRSLKGRIRAIVSEQIRSDVNPNLRSLASIGFTTDTNGLLITKEEDINKLSDAIDNNFDEVGRLFARSAVATDSQIRVNSFGASTPEEGAYNINFSTLNLGTSIEGTLGQLNLSSSDGFSAAGTGVLAPVSFEVFGGNAGNRGNIIVNEGVASKLSSIIDDYIGSGGLLADKTSGLNERLSTLTDSREKLAERAESLTNRYLKQFNALDLLVSQLQSTGSFLTQSLSGLPGFTQDTNN